MRLLLAGNDVTVIALWLGHEQLSTTNLYMDADMSQKQKAIARTNPLDAKPGLYQPRDPLLAFLQDNVYFKIGARNRVGATRYAARWGLLGAA
jgi:hypothetical protein